MRLAKMILCWMLLIFGTANGEDYVEFDVSETKIFSAAIQCLPSYQSKDNIQYTLTFSLTNNDQQDYSVLKLHTPLEGEPSDCLRVTRNGKKLEYDGIFVKRSLPGPEDFLLVAAGKTVSSTFDVSAGYDMSESGTYTVAVDTYLEYVVGSAMNMNVPGKSAIPTNIGHLTSPAVVFNVADENRTRKTLGQKVRSLEKKNRFHGNIFSRGSTKVAGNLEKLFSVMNIPRDPIVEEGTDDQKAEVKEVHRAAYHYIKAAISDLNNSPERVKTWFGKLCDIVVKVFAFMKESLEKDVITYNFKGSYCRPGAFAYTYKYSRTIYLCGTYVKSQIMSGFDNKVGVLVHELSHVLTDRDDILYGRSGCRSLAKSSPNKACMNSDNYEYFVETLYPFNQGIDAATTLSGSYTYMFKGNFFVKFQDGSSGARYPTLIKQRFGNLPAKFAQGFDSFVCHKRFDHAYAVNGGEYIRFKDLSANQLSEGYPKPIYGHWGDMPSDFTLGFDSWVQLPNGVTYVTKGAWYLRYSRSNGHASDIDLGYPKTLDSGGWGRLPENFRSGFDAMTVLPNGKLYVFKGTEYIRYTHFSWQLIDSGYPLPIKGNWGNVPQD